MVVQPCSRYLQTYWKPVFGKEGWIVWKKVKHTGKQPKGKAS